MLSRPSFQLATKTCLQTRSHRRQDWTKLSQSQIYRELLKIVLTCRQFCSRLVRVGSVYTVCEQNCTMSCGTAGRRTHPAAPQSQADQTSSSASTRFSTVCILILRYTYTTIDGPPTRPASPLATGL